MFFERKGICNQIIFLQNGENSSPQKYHCSSGVLASDLKPIQAASWEVESKGIFPLRSCTFTLYFNANGEEP